MKLRQSLKKTGTGNTYKHSFSSRKRPGASPKLLPRMATSEHGSKGVQFGAFKTPEVSPLGSVSVGKTLSEMTNFEQLVARFPSDKSGRRSRNIVPRRVSKIEHNKLDSRIEPCFPNEEIITPNIAERMLEINTGTLPSASVDYDFKASEVSVPVSPIATLTAESSPPALLYRPREIVWMDAIDCHTPLPRRLLLPDLGNK